ncbi:MAG: hypothetical protein ACM31C_27095 [Acidobacteriota bacterium]
MTKLVLLTIVLCGCEGLTSPAEPRVSVLERTGDSCFALMTEGSPVDPALGVADLCPYATGHEMLAGLDLIELVVDYGPDVSFAASTTAPPPTVTVTVDGAAVELPVALSEEHRVGDRAYFIATFRAPATPSRDVEITAGVNSGFRTTVPVVFTTIAPQVELDLTDCMPDVACELAGAVGDAHVRLLLPGDVPETIAIHEAIDGIAQPDPVPPVTTQLVGTHTEATAAIPVPAVHDGAMLVLSASFEGGFPSLATATIRAPSLTIQLSCGDSCNLAAGDAVGIEIDAPAAIQPLQALVDTRLDGAPQLIAAPVTLIPNASGRAVGTIAVTAPSAGTWQIDATVAGYPTPAFVTTVH